MEPWLVGGALAFVAIAFVAWDIRNSLRRGRRSGDGGGDCDGDGGGGDGD